ncbi:MAG: peptidylprolyl isomerase [bacterium]
MRTERMAVAAAILGVFLFAACERTTPGDSSGHAPKGHKSEGAVLAKVGGEVITQQDFEKELSSLPEFTKKQMQTGEQKRKRLERMIDESVLLQEARKRGLERDEDIRSKVEKYRNRLLTEKLYQVVAEEKAAVDESEVAAYYEKNKEQFTQKERIHARQILILVPPNAGPEKEKEAQAKAKEAQVKAKAGEDFVALAKKYSDAPDPLRAGDLGYFSRGRMPPEFEEAAFSLANAGDVSEIVRTKFGYHVIQLMDRQPAKEQPLEEVRDRVVRVLKSQKTREIRQTLAGELRGKTTVEIDEAFLKEEAAAAQAPPAPAGQGQSVQPASTDVSSVPAGTEDDAEGGEEAPALPAPVPEKP